MHWLTPRILTYQNTYNMRLNDVIDMHMISNTLFYVYSREVQIYVYGLTIRIAVWS